MTNRLLPSVVASEIQMRDSQPWVSGHIFAFLIGAALTPPAHILTTRMDSFAMLRSYMRSHIISRQLVPGALYRALIDAFSGVCRELL